MIESCEVCGIKFADQASVNIHSLKVHKFDAPVSVSHVLPTIGDGSTGVKGSGLVKPSLTSKKSQAQIIDELENRLGIHNFYGYTIHPLPEAKPALVKKVPEVYENAYADFFKKLGTIEFDLAMRPR